MIKILYTPLTNGQQLYIYSSIQFFCSTLTIIQRLSSLISPKERVDFTIITVNKNKFSCLLFANKTQSTI